MPDFYWPDDDPRWEQEDADPGFWPIFINALERDRLALVFILAGLLVALGVRYV